MQSREEILATMGERARDFLFMSGNCAQASFAVLQEQFGFEGEGTLKALTAMPGLALTGETCGAVSGCLMALGSVYGRESLTDVPGFQRALPPARRFCRAFTDHHGSTRCDDILTENLGQDYDLGSSVEFKEYVQCGGMESCADVVASAVEIAAEILAEAADDDQSDGWYA